MDDHNEICLYGTVGESFWGEECFTPTSVRALLAGRSGPLTVRINSGGGIAVDGQTIHNLLKDYPDEVHVVVDGVAASAASLIAMAGDRITMQTGSILMIHDPASPWVDGRGTEADHLKAARALGFISEAYAKVYAARAGITPQAARDIMRAETFYNDETAVEAGFADAADTEPAQAVALFDYGLYAHAPQTLLDAGASISRPASRKAIVAMIQGVDARSQKGQTMSKTKMEDGDTTVGGAGEDTVAAAGAGEDTVAAGSAGDDTMAGGGAVQASALAVAQGSVAAAIMRLCESVGEPLSAATKMVEKGLTLEQAVTEIHSKKGEPMTAQIQQGGASARITRDERDTMRAGMAGAIVAQMARSTAVEGPAREFMGMSLVDMAAASIGHRGSIRTVAAREDVFRAAMTSSTSDFPAVFENALNKRLLTAYKGAEPTYRQIAARMDFTDFRPHPVSGMGDFPTLLPVGEGGEIKEGSSSDKKETLQANPFGRVFRITRQMLINDDLGAIDRMLGQRGLVVANFEEAQFYSMLLGGSNADGPTMTETARQLCNTTDGTKAGTAAAITVASVSLGRAAMRAKTGLGKDAADKIKLNIPPRILLVGPNKETEAEQLVAAIQPQAAGSVNPFSGKLEVVVSAFITDNSWYLFADPNLMPTVAYGFLTGFEGPRMRIDEPFGSQGMAFSVEEDFGTGAVDFRGIYKNAGA